MDATELAGFRTTLEEQRAELLHQLEEMGFGSDGSALEGDGFDPGFADSAHSTAERGNTLTVAERLRDQMADVDHALTRIADGTYGTCETCGKPIPRERLEALPYSTQCVDCKQRSG
jgi:RNA polymerase-binding protein DksA